MLRFKLQKRYIYCKFSGISELMFNEKYKTVIALSFCTDFAYLSLVWCKGWDKDGILVRTLDGSHWPPGLEYVAIWWRQPTPS